MDRQISYQTRSSLHSMISCASRWRIVSRADRTSSESDAAQAAATSPCSVPVQARTSPSDVASTPFCSDAAKPFCTGWMNSLGITPPLISSTNSCWWRSNRHSACGPAWWQPRRSAWSTVWRCIRRWVVASAWAINRPGGQPLGCPRDQAVASHLATSAVAGMRPLLMTLSLITSAGVDITS